MLLNGKNPHGGDIYRNPPRLDFSANINPAGMPDAVKEALVRSVEDCAVYPDPRCEALREAIAGAEGVPVSFILCGNGSAELIYQYAWTLADDGRPALIVHPAFSEYGAALRAAGVGEERYVMREEDGFRLTRDILRYDFGRVSAVFLCSPDNPTGLTVEPEILEDLLRTGARVFCDLCFLDLTADPGKYDLPRLIREYPNLTVLRAFTKSCAMAGVRLGYALSADGDFLGRMAERGQCWNVSTPAQKAGIAALGCRGWLESSVKRICSERERLAREMAACGIRVVPGEANFLLMYSDKPVREELAARGIALRDCSDYVGLGPGWFRAAVRTREENDELIFHVREVTK